MSSFNLCYSFRYVPGMRCMNCSHWVGVKDRGKVNDGRLEYNPVDPNSHCRRLDIRRSQSLITSSLLGTMTEVSKMAVTPTGLSNIGPCISKIIPFYLPRNEYLSYWRGINYQNWIYSLFARLSLECKSSHVAYRNSG